MTGSFRWVDFTPNAGGNSEIRDQLAGSTAVCDIRVGSNVQQPGVQQGAKAAYNTRFGIYPNGANAYTAATLRSTHRLCLPEPGTRRPGDLDTRG